MKKVLSVLLAVVLLFALTACSKDDFALVGTYNGGDITVKIAEDGTVVWTQGEETFQGSCEESEGQDTWLMDLEGNTKAEYLVTVNEMSDGVIELWLTDSTGNTIALVKE